MTVFDSGPCDWLVLPLLLPSPTTQFSLYDKRRSRERNRKNGNVLILPTPLTTRIFDFHKVISSLMTQTTTPTPSLVKTTLEGGSVAEWFRALDLKSGGAWFKSSTLLLSGFILYSPEFNSSTALCKTNWSASHQLGFLIIYVLFEIFSSLFTVSPISTTVLNTYDT